MFRFQDETRSKVRAHISMPVALALLLAFTATVPAQRPVSSGRSSPQLPDGAGREVTHKVCGATCHGPEIMIGKGRTRDQWTAVVNAMVGRGYNTSERIP